MGLTLQNIPGFADLSNASLQAGDIVHSLHLAKINENSNFGVVRTEVFSGFFVNNQQIPLPVSTADGYNYSRSELSYIWGLKSSFNPQTGAMSGRDALWMGAWKVDQDTGVVSTYEVYRRSGDHADPVESNDGTLFVIVIAQRQNATITMASEPTYTSLSTPATDDPFKESLAQGLNDNGKFGVVASEVIYMGEFIDGDTVPQPQSVIDGKTYAYSAVKFQPCWRWTPDGTTFQAPDDSVEQLGPMLVSINPSTGVVDITVKYTKDGGETLVTKAGHGRIAVFAFCSRQGSLSFSPAADDFIELDPNKFLPGSTLRAADVSQIILNQKQAIATPEFFGPTSYGDGDTIPTPTSPIDSYAYSRDEIFYVWEWNDTSPNTGSHLRMGAWDADINTSTGVVTLKLWRVPPGSAFDQDAGFGSILVTVVAIRQREPGDGGVSGDAASAVSGQTFGPSTPDSVYQRFQREVSFWMEGITSTPSGSIKPIPATAAVDTIGTGAAVAPTSTDLPGFKYSRTASATTAPAVVFAYRNSGATAGTLNMGLLQRAVIRVRTHQSSSVRWWIGIMQGLSGSTEFSTDTPNKKYAAFRYSDGTDTTWKAVCGTATASQTVVDTGVAIDTTQGHTFDVRPADGKVKFYLDGQLVATISTNVPADSEPMNAAALGDNKNTATAMDMTFYFMQCLDKGK